MKKKLIKVTGAAILEANHVFAVQRSEDMTLTNYWEFPGGKIEANESKEDAIIREIKEELEVDIQIIDYIDTAEYDYDFGTVRLHLFTAEIVNGDLTLNEHKDFQWIPFGKLTEIDWAPVDVPLAKTLQEKLFN